jgi:hypothetical protein
MEHDMSAIFDDEKPEAYHWRMNTETRIEKLEADEAGQTADLALIKANYATKDDIAELKIMFGKLESEFKAHSAETKAQLAEAKTSIIQWSVTAIFIAQLLPALLKLLLPS